MILLLSQFITVVLILAIYAFKKNSENYWKKQGLPVHGHPVWRYLTENKSISELFHEIYKKYPNEPAVGLSTFFSKNIYVKDPENVQHIEQTDFTSFSARAGDVSEHDLLANNILFLDGPKWKLLRQSMTPLFTTSKLKNMYYIIDKSAKDFIDNIRNNPENVKGSENVFLTLSTFCAAAVGSAVFGISSEGSTYDSPFLKMAQTSFAPTFISNARFSIGIIFPGFLKTFRIKIFGEHEKFFIGAIKRLLRQREKDNVPRHDFGDICKSLQKNGKLKLPENNFEMEPTDEVLAAQAFFFFVAGVEPTASALYGTLIELGTHKEILEKVHREIDAVWEKYEGKFTYDAMQEVKYLDKVMSEAMRMYPPIGFNTRRCVKDSVLPVGNIKIKKGTMVFTPIFEYHHDAKMYPNPEVFDPERFDGDAKSGEITYQPFGKGNRICVGMRYARLQAKAGLVHLLRDFTVQTEVLRGGVKFSKQQVQIRPVNVNMELNPRKIKCT